MLEVKSNTTTSYLAFGVYPHGDNLFSACITKLKNGKVSEWRHGTGTTLGHAIAMAENLMSAYALYQHEVSAEAFYNDAVIL